MASGKKNYFRHSFNAVDDIKIQTAIDKLGIQGYAYYFILIEVLAKKCEEGCYNPITIHQQTLRSVWRKQAKSCKKVVTLLQESGLFVATFNENYIEFDIPNLSKYLGKYSAKLPPNVPNQSKLKEIKEKESKVNKKLPYTPDDLIDLWNESIGNETNQTLLSLSPDMIRKFIENTEHIKTIGEWASVFEKCKESNFLMGVEKEWKVSLKWLLDYENFYKVFNNTYSSNQDAWMDKWVEQDD